MKRPALLSLAFALLVAMASPFPATANEAARAPAGLTEKDVEEVFRRLIREEPELIIASLTELNARRQAAAQAAAKEQLKNLSTKLAAHDPMVIGTGDVTIFEFFDYRCGYCRKADPVVRRLATSGEIKVVYVELPILGPDSHIAAEYSLAARYQGWGQWFAYHQALMNANGALNAGVLQELAGSVGLDVDQLRADLKTHANDIRAAIAANAQIAQDLAISGTPSFVIGDEIVRGYIDANQMRQRVAAARRVQTDVPNR